MADDFDMDQYIKSNTGSDTSNEDTENDFNMDQYIKDNGHHGDVFEESMLNPQESSANGPSIGETVAGQGLQGLTAGFSDELAGLGSGAMQAATGDFGPKQGRDWEAIKAAYTQMRDSERKKLDAQSQANPGTSLAANVIGGIPTAIATGGTGLAGAVGLGATAGLGSSKQDIANQGLEALPGALQDTATGAGLGAAGYGVAKGVGKLLSPEARALGQKGQTIFGKKAQESVSQETEQLANDIVTGISKEKGKIGKAYEAILDANKDQNIDLNDFADKLKIRAEAFDTSLPEQARDKKAILDLVAKVTEGPEVSTTSVTGYKPGKMTSKDVLTGYEPTKSVEAVPSAREQLESEGSKLVESQRQLGKSASYNINPSEDENLITRVLKTEGENDPSAVAKTIENTPGSPAYTQVEPVIEQQPFSTEISPIIETNVAREGGSLTPSTDVAKKFRSDLGTLAYEKNLTTAGEKFGQETYRDLTQTLKQQIPGLGPTDEKFTELLNAARKMGIKGDDEDVVRVLSKMTSDNQGKQIIVNQALESLDKVNPELSNQIRQTAQGLDKKAEMIDKVSHVGNYNLLNPKQLILGLLKDFSSLRAASGNIAGLAERNAIKTPIGNLVQKSVKATPLAVSESPWSQKKLQSKPVEERATQLSSSLYNATDDSLKEVASNLSKTPGLGFYGEHLNKAIDTNDEGEKKRAIFLILQNPKSRKLISPEKK